MEPNGHTADVVAAALAEKMTALPADLRRSLTWDRGKEMAQHADFSVASGMPVYFCDPRSPWQRGSNENTNWLLRQYFPKRDFDLRALTQTELDDIATNSTDALDKPSAGDHHPKLSITRFDDRRVLVTQLPVQTRVAVTIQAAEV